jgi:hypothetical protein
MDRKQGVNEQREQEERVGGWCVYAAPGIFDNPNQPSDLSKR